MILIDVFVMDRIPNDIVQIVYKYIHNAKYEDVLNQLLLDTELLYHQIDTIPPGPIGSMYIKYIKTPGCKWKLAYHVSLHYWN